MGVFLWPLMGNSATINKNRGPLEDAVLPTGCSVFACRSGLDFVESMGRARPQTTRRYAPGDRLRALRLVLGLSLREVYAFSVKLSKKLRNPGFILPSTRLHEFETRNVVPSIHRLYTLARAYEYELTEFLNWYGIPETMQSSHTREPRSKLKLPPTSRRPPN